MSLRFFTSRCAYGNPVAVDAVEPQKEGSAGESRRNINFPLVDAFDIPGQDVSLSGPFSRYFNRRPGRRIDVVAPEFVGWEGGESPGPAEVEDEVRQFGGFPRHGRDCRATGRPGRVEIKAEFGNRGFEPRAEDAQPRLGRHQRGESQQPFPADGRRPNDLLPLFSVPRVENERFDPLTQTEILLDHGHIEGPGPAQIVLNLKRGTVLIGPRWGLPQACRRLGTALKEGCPSDSTA